MATREKRRFAMVKSPLPNIKEPRESKLVYEVTDRDGNVLYYECAYPGCEGGKNGQPFRSEKGPHSIQVHFGTKHRDVTGKPDPRTKKPTENTDEGERLIAALTHYVESQKAGDWKERALLAEAEVASLRRRLRRLIGD